MSDASELQARDDPTPVLPVPHYGILKGPNGLRADWRLLIFFAILLPLGYGVSGGVDALIRRTHADFSTPLDAVFSIDLLALPLLIATWIMGRIERRTFADLGLPWRRAFGRRFWQGACCDNAACGRLLIRRHCTARMGCVEIRRCVGCSTIPGRITRGLPLSRISAVHVDDGDRLLAGSDRHVLTHGWIALLQSQRSWAGTGVGDGHLFSASFHGNPWLTGGGFGPEASIFTLVLLAIWGVIFSVWLRGVRYPNPAAVQRPQGGSPTEGTAARKL